MKLPRLLPIILATVGSTWVVADVIHLKNGDRITGKIKEIWDDNVTIKPEYSDKFDVEFEHIANIETDEAFEVELFDGTKGDFQLDTSMNPGTVKLVSSSKTLDIALKEIKRTKQIKPIDWKSHVDLNSSFSRGNTNSQLIYLQGDYKLKVKDHRYLGDISSIREEKEGSSVKNQDRLHLAYNYLYRDHWFFALNSTIERDPIALLDQRTSLSSSIGYDVWDEANRTLNVQLGLGYAHEKTAGEDESSSLIDWRLEVAYTFLRGDMELFHNHHIYRNNEGRKNLVFNSVTGIRYEITDDIYLNLQLNYDYDSKPAENTDEEDLTFVVGAGLAL